MTMRMVALLLLATALVAPNVSAQGPFAGITLTATPPTETIAYMGSIEVPFSVKVGCSTLVQHGLGSQSPTPKLTVHADEAPRGLTVKEATLTFSDPSPCATGSGFITKNDKVTFMVDASAAGVVTQNVTLLAHFGDAESDAGEFVVPFTVAYHSNYTVLPDVTFPLKVMNGTATFHVTITQNSNARSMVMIEDVKETGGKISGLGSVPYNSPETKKFTVTYKAPLGPWTEQKVTFTSYGHFLLLDQRAGSFTDAKPTTWTFTNGGGEAPQGTTSKASPLPLPFLALAGAALIAARRRD